MTEERDSIGCKHCTGVMNKDYDTYRLYYRGDDHIEATLYECDDCGKIELFRKK